MWSAFPGYNLCLVPQQQVQYTQYEKPVQYSQREDPESSWKFLDSIDPLALSVPHDLKLLKTISKQFVETVVLNIDTQSRMQKLLQILQMVIRLLSAKSTKRKQKIRTLQHELSSRGSHGTPKSSSKTVKIIACRCPVCQLGFKTLTYLDMHMFSKHKDVSMLWQALRTPQGMGSVALPQSPLQSPAPAPVTPPPAPASPQGVDQATMQRMFDDFRRQYENERRDSDMQAQAMIRQEMQRLAAKMDDLSNQARAEAEARQMPAGGKQFGKPRLSPLAPAKGAHVDLSDEAPSGGGRRGKRESDSSNGIGTRMRQSPMRTPPVRQTPPQREPVDLPLLSESESDLSLSSGAVLNPNQQTPAPEIEVPNIPNLSRASSRKMPLESFLSEVSHDDSWSDHRKLESSSANEKTKKPQRKVPAKQVKPQPQPQRNNPFDDNSASMSSTAKSESDWDIPVPKPEKPDPRRYIKQREKNPFDEDSFEIGATQNAKDLGREKPVQRQKPAKQTKQVEKNPFDEDSDSFNIGATQNARESGREKTVQRPKPTKQTKPIEKNSFDEDSEPLNRGNTKDTADGERDKCGQIAQEQNSFDTDSGSSTAPKHKDAGRVVDRPGQKQNSVQDHDSLDEDSASWNHPNLKTAGDQDSDEELRKLPLREDKHARDSFDDDSDSLNIQTPERKNKERQQNKPSKTAEKNSFDSHSFDVQVGDEQIGKQAKLPEKNSDDESDSFNLGGGSDGENADQSRRPPKKPAKTSEKVFHHDSDSLSEPEIGEIPEASPAKEVLESGEVVQPRPTRRLLDVGELPVTQAQAPVKPDNTKQGSSGDSFPFDMESSGSLGARRKTRQKKAVAPSFDSDIAQEIADEKKESDSKKNSESPDFDGFDIDDIDLGDM